MEDSRTIGKPTFECSFCGKKLNNKSNLNRHVKNVHSVGRPSPKYCSRLLCPDQSCNKKFTMDSDLREHLGVSHGIVVSCDKLEFDTEAG